MKKRKRNKLLVIVTTTLLLIVTVVAVASPEVRHWLHEAFCYVVSGIVVLLFIVVFIIFPAAGHDQCDRSQDTIDWEMEQDRLKQIKEDEEWIKSHR